MKELEDTAEDKQSEVVLSVGDGSMVIRNGSGGLNERTVDGCSLTISDVVWRFLFQTQTQLRYQILLIHSYLDVEPYLFLIYYIKTLFLSSTK